MKCPKDDCWMSNMTKRQNKLVSDFVVNVDLSAYHQDVLDYIQDQLRDRLYELKDHELEVTDEGDGTLTVSVPILELIGRIKDEKVADMEWERKHGD